MLEKRFRIDYLELNIVYHNFVRLHLNSIWRDCYEKDFCSLCRAFSSV